MVKKSSIPLIKIRGGGLKISSSLSVR